MEVDGRRAAQEDLMVDPSKVPSIIGGAEYFFQLQARMYVENY